MEKVRVRVAPSPTGDPHVGLAYIFLFNYIFAKKNGGEVVLRVEDTDQTRSRESSEKDIMRSLRWLGLTWDEGPDCGGEYGPYRQSERKAIHAQYAHQLVEEGFAYYCFCSPERLQRLREEQKKQGLKTGYDGHCRDIPLDLAKRRAEAGEPYVVRLKMPKSGVSQFKDELRGEIKIDYDQLDDQVLLKADGFPTYHLANVVDDHLMKISHVIRAEEWISSTPKHIALYQAFGWEPPKFIHMPLLRNQDRSKISKRKNPVSINFYQKKGILPEAMVNFLSLMGWAYGDDREKFTLAEMEQKFSIEQISLGGPIFDIKKLEWLNSCYLKEMSDDNFIKHLREQVFSTEYLRKIKPLCIERLESFDQFVDKNNFFFNGALDYDAHLLVPKGKSAKEMVTAFTALVDSFDELHDWTVNEIEKVFSEKMKLLSLKPRELFMPMRIAITGRKDSPPLMETVEVLGRELVRFRVREGIKKLKQS